MAFAKFRVAKKQSKRPLRVYVATTLHILQGHLPLLRLGYM